MEIERDVLTGKVALAQAAARRCRLGDHPDLVGRVETEARRDQGCDHRPRPHLVDVEVGDPWSVVEALPGLDRTCPPSQIADLLTRRSDHRLHPGGEGIGCGVGDGPQDRCGLAGSQVDIAAPLLEQRS